MLRFLPGRTIEAIKMRYSSLVEKISEYRKSNEESDEELIKRYLKVMVRSGLYFKTIVEEEPVRTEERNFQMHPQTSTNIEETMNNIK